MCRKNNSHYYLCTCISAILTQKMRTYTTRSGLAIMIRNNAKEKGGRDASNLSTKNHFSFIYSAHYCRDYFDLGLQTQNLNHH